MKHPIRTIGGAALLAAVGAASPACADPLCGRDDRMPVAGKYLVQNIAGARPSPGTSASPSSIRARAVNRRSNLGLTHI
jgi:hypothetical protein